MLRYLDDLDAAHDNDIITVVLSEFVLDKWWEQLLHNQSALVLKTPLLPRRGARRRGRRRHQPSVLIATALIPLRDVIASRNAALILVLPMVIVALIAGFAPGATAAVTAALAFGFFLTAPYHSPTIQAAEDVESAAVLLVIALVVSQLLAREVQARDRST